MRNWHILQLSFFCFLPSSDNTKHRWVLIRRIPRLREAKSYSSLLYPHYRLWKGSHRCAVNLWLSSGRFFVWSVEFHHRKHKWSISNPQGRADNWGMTSLQNELIKGHMFVVAMAWGNGSPGISATGSGKTLAYLLPCFSNLAACMAWLGMVKGP